MTDVQIHKKTIKNKKKQKKPWFSRQNTFFHTIIRLLNGILRILLLRILKRLIIETIQSIRSLAGANWMSKITHVWFFITSKVNSWEMYRKNESTVWFQWNHFTLMEAKSRIQFVRLLILNNVWARVTRALVIWSTTKYFHPSQLIHSAISELVNV